MNVEDIRNNAANSDHSGSGYWLEFRRFCRRKGLVVQGYLWAHFLLLSDEVLEEAYAQFQIEKEE